MQQTQPLRTNNAKASLTVNNLNKHLSTLQLDIIDNSNIINAGLSRGGLPLNSQDLGKLAINFTNPKTTGGWGVNLVISFKSIHSEGIYSTRQTRQNTTRRRYKFFYKGGYTFQTFKC